MANPSRTGIAYLLLFSVFIIATCGLIYELVAGALASYLLGDSITQFSTVIGAYLFAMGIGSFLSRYFHQNLIAVFIRVELLIGLIGGCSAAVLFLVFEWVDFFRLILYGQVVLTGILVGLEIPLLMRILKDQFEFKELVSQVFTFDYIGALIASVLFPLLLVPGLGLVRTAFFFGILNTLVAMAAIFTFRNEVKRFVLQQISAGFVLLVLIVGFVFSPELTRFAETLGYPQQIIYARSSPYQRIILTHERDELRLYLNGNLQFSSRDEYRYHEALVHPALQSVAHPERVLILGGGDGLALREVLKYPGVDSVFLVDLDPAVTRLFTSHEGLLKLNDSSLLSSKVRVYNEDAFQWVKQHSGTFEVIILDFPDPSNYSLGKLYSLRFYRELQRILAPGGRAVVQSTSPLVARQSFWCVAHTLEAAGLSVDPYHCYVPSFGEWGFILAGHREYHSPEAFLTNLRFLNAETFKLMRQFPPDMAEVPTEINRLNEQSLVRYFEKEWRVYE